RRVLVDGVELPDRPTINFTGAGVTVTDNPTNNRYEVSIPGAASGGGLTEVTGTAPVAVTTPSTGVRNIAVGAASGSSSGLMSAADKAKLTGLPFTATTRLRDQR